MVVSFMRHLASFMLCTHTHTHSPVDGEGLACWLLLGHADDAGGAAVGAAQPRAAHAVGPAAHAQPRAHLRVVHQVAAVHGQDPSVGHTGGAGVRLYSHRQQLW